MSTDMHDDRNPQGAATGDPAATPGTSLATALLGLETAGAMAADPAPAGGRVSIREAGESASSTAGTMLANARERCHLSLGDVANHLKLAVRQVEALEADAFDRLPSPMFVRGFVRSYARLVQLDPAPVMAVLERQLPVQAPPAMAPSLADSTPVLAAAVPFPSPGQRSRRMHSAVALLAAVVVGFIAFEWFGPMIVPGIPSAGLEPAPQVARDPAVMQPGVQADTLPTEAGATSLPAPAAPVPASPVPGPGATPEAPAAASPASTSELGRAFGPGPRTVRLFFDRESWVEIRDARGRLIFSQTNPPGSSQVIQGEPPLSLVVGNARSVRLAYGDRDINLEPHTRVDVARLKLD